MAEISIISETISVLPALGLSDELFITEISHVETNANLNPSQSGKSTWNLHTVRVTTKKSFLLLTLSSEKYSSVSHNCREWTALAYEEKHPLKPKIPVRCIAMCALRKSWIRHASYLLRCHMGYILVPVWHYVSWNLTGWLNGFIPTASCSADPKAPYVI